MLRFFFHRDSTASWLAEIAGLLLTGPWGWHLFSTNDSALRRVLFILFLAEVLFLVFCDAKCWYEKERRDLGIAIHFAKIRVVVRYLLFFTALIGFVFNSFALMPLALLLLTFFVYVNLSLIYFHLKDRGSHPVNFFSKESRDKEKREG